MLLKLGLCIAVVIQLTSASFLDAQTCSRMNSTLNSLMNDIDSMCGTSQDGLPSKTLERLRNQADVNPETASTTTITSTTATTNITRNPLSTQSGDTDGSLTMELTIIVTLAVALLVTIVVSAAVVVCCVRKQRRKSSESKRQSKVVTTNPVYHCEELEDAPSVYDELVVENQYVDETEECDQGSAPPPPNPRPVAESQDQKQNSGYEALNNETSNHVYLLVINDEIEGCETEGCDQDTAAQDND